ncbi:hypothetical protein M3O96_01415 [Aquiflexum sp. TKW24L]|uniref:hypothetical protein n=1 Tax=Aquiflexum sp. TKW24L TaxID=2942212 RepID=UPI0020BF71B7|nr:hypothetical protein [Aquiflexum sp. TKW24L]MCL6257727.1 hypothetical protein [Aquiflexum sp. TKW24L]
MRKLLSLLLLGALATISACMGPVGPPGIPGPQGQQGQPGINIVAEAFQIDVNFTPQNQYLVEFPLNPALVEGDVLLIFIRWEIFNGNAIWRAMPQTVFLEEGVLVYNYDFSRIDFSVFLESSFDPGILSPSFTRNQRFRVVIVPADLSSRIDYTDYEAVVKMLGLSEEDFVNLEPKK